MNEGATANQYRRIGIDVLGVVQGVGFRPYVYQLATAHQLGGFVQNDPAGVHIEVEGDPRAVRKFLKALSRNPPRRAELHKVDWRELSPTGTGTFQIAASAPDAAPQACIPPDLPTCLECLEELHEPGNRRNGHPFISCTSCGPRFTVIQTLPYDRTGTTMAGFPLCSLCDGEYRESADRRFHAQTIACPACGPVVHHMDMEGNPIEGGDSITTARAALAAGEILAVKGLGGFHLCCDALNESAVATLRTRKFRAAKPFALMADSVEMIARFAVIGAAEKKLLESDARPIVLLRRLGDSSGLSLADTVAPGMSELGFMLPYTPVHALLLRDQPGPMVMTSANRSEEPIVYRSAEAPALLGCIADSMLDHNREIVVRCEDSVARVWDGAPRLIRRARGYVPRPILLANSCSRILACGAEQKSTFCMVRGREAFLSPHLGDLENVEAMEGYQETISHFRRLLGFDPEVVAHDFHPEYLSTQWARSQPWQTIPVQHHHAHMASAMAENGLSGEVIGVVFDGLGYGHDDAFWGGEFFVADYGQCLRRYHLGYVPMPGGSQAVREPWRMAVAHLHKTYGADWKELDIPFVRALDSQAYSTLVQMIMKGVNCPSTSGAGRLFDAVAALLGIGNVAQYEGQAAIALETLAGKNEAGAYPLTLESEQQSIDLGPLIRAIVEDIQAGEAAGRIAARFHRTLAEIILITVRWIATDHGLTRVVLSGGVFQNVLLLTTAQRLLRESGLQVYTQRAVPCNDGGIALGQALVADALLKNPGRGGLAAS